VFQRRTSGSVVCPSCGSLVGVRDDKCYMCGRANPSLWGFAPLLRQLGSDMGFVPLVIGASTVLFALTLLASGPGLRFYAGGFNILVPSIEALWWFGASGAGPVFGNNLWLTLLSASWLHGSLLHILFNMMWVRDIGPATADVIGPGRTIIIYVVSGVTGFLLSSVAGAFFPVLPFLGGSSGITIGASASIFGLLGALVHYGRISGSSLIRGQATQWALMLFLFGLFMRGVDNYAHAGGFIGGYGVSWFFNPLTRERGDHMIVALACLALTFGAIVYSLLQGFPAFR
jgi:rhomboid protease GluP